jgi:rhodanese-related sulfurtransferase
MTDDIPGITAGDVDELDDPVLLDVREPDEFEAGHAPGAVLHPLATLPDAWTDFPTDRTVLCVCRTGARSAHATEFLRRQGLDAVNLEGGMQAWQAFGLDVVRSDGSFGAVV